MIQIKNQNKNYQKFKCNNVGKNCNVVLNYTKIYFLRGQFLFSFEEHFKTNTTVKQALRMDKKLVQERK